MKPIRWKVKRVARGYEKALERAGVVSSNIVVVDGAEDAALRFSAFTECGDESTLLLGIIAAFCASEGIRKDTGIISWVRWPNVVAIDGEEVATTSALVTRGEDKSRVELDFSISVSGAVGVDGTTLCAKLGVEVDRDLLMEKVLESLSWMQFGWSTGMHDQILGRVRSMTETIGSRVGLRSGKTGVAGDVDGAGRLVVLLANGKKVRLESREELTPLR